MGLTRQAKTLTKVQFETVKAFLRSSNQAERNLVMFLLSTKAGLRAKEIGSITWSMVLTSDQIIDDCIRLENSASKGMSGGIIWINNDLKIALSVLKESLGNYNAHHTIIQSCRNKPMSAQQIVNWFWLLYRRLGFIGCSSHSGRRTFITGAAKKISSVGGSIRDVQSLARHSSLAMTQRYIDADVDAQKRVVNLI